MQGKTVLQPLNPYRNRWGINYKSTHMLVLQGEDGKIKKKTHKTLQQCQVSNYSPLESSTQGLGQSNGPWTFEFQATVTLEKKEKKEETEGNDVSLVVLLFQEGH